MKVLFGDHPAKITEVYENLLVVQAPVRDVTEDLEVKVEVSSKDSNLMNGDATSHNTFTFRYKCKKKKQNIQE